jgi:hypothetical protein
MANTDQVKEILEHSFSGAEIDISADDESGKISGSLIWPGFEGRTFLRRQTDLNTILRRELKADARSILHIFTYTPNEYDLMQSIAND